MLELWKECRDSVLNEHDIAGDTQAEAGRDQHFSKTVQTAGIVPAGPLNLDRRLARVAGQRLPAFLKILYRWQACGSKSTEKSPGDYIKQRETLQEAETCSPFVPSFSPCPGVLRPF